MGHPLTWMYRRLGPRYPRVFVTVELLSAFVIAGGAVALLSFYYDAEREDVLSILAVTLGLTAAAMVVVLHRLYRRLRPIEEWIAGERDERSSLQAWSAAVMLPYDLVRRDLPLPVLGVALLSSLVAALAYELAPIAFFPLFGSGLIALGYSMILHYLAIELAMRPVLFDINAGLERPPRITRPALPLRIKLIASLPLINVITGAVVAALTSDGGGAQALSINVLIALAVSFVISFELVWLLSRSILRPIYDLEAAIERIRQGRFDEHVPVTTADEFGELSSGFNQMVDGLSERERLREAFGTYLDEEVARHIISEGYDPEGQDVEVSILFCDVHDFTGAAAGAEAGEIVSRLNELFECLVPIISRHRGHVDQFIGDAALAVFGAPEQVPAHADRAVQAAVEIARTVNSRKPGGFTVGVGVNSGKVVAGSLGGAGRLTFSVIGDAVNVAARVENLTRTTGDPVLITAASRDLLSETIEVAPRGKFEFRGHDAIELYAPVVPEALPTDIPGEDVREVDGGGVRVKSADEVDAGVGLGRRPTSGLGRPAPGRVGRTHTLPGR